MAEKKGSRSCAPPRVFMKARLPPKCLGQPGQFSAGRYRSKVTQPVISRRVLPLSPNSS